MLKFLAPIWQAFNKLINHLDYDSNKFNPISPIRNSGNRINLVFVDGCGQASYSIANGSPITIIINNFTMKNKRRFAYENFYCQCAA